MSSATSTKGSPSRTLPGGSPSWSDSRADDGLRPWQFFVLAALGCATAVTWLARGQGVTAVVLLSILMAAVALAGMAALRTLTPLVSPIDDRTEMVGERTRLALEREKLLTLRAIKELEFDRAMNKLSDEDFREMSGRLRARAARLMKQLDAGADYRERIEQDLAKRLGVATGEATGAAVASTVRAPMAATKSCASCSTANDTDARFCKACGAKL
jgi:pyruvate/2-oxoacid:ferredoxin oxidoreductase beta subunit